MTATVPTLVSIVTPTLNQGVHIGETIESVRRQSYVEIEHIVVDGGSTDGTLEILGAAAGTYRMHWSSEPDRGMYDAVNKGLARATGEIVMYLNSDDLLLPWAVEVAVASFDANPEIDIVYGDALSLDDETRRLDLRLQVPFRRERLARFGSLVQPSVLWRRALRKSVGGFDSELQFVGDLDFWLRATGSARVHQLDEVLSVYRIHPGAKTSRSKGPMRAEEDRMRAGHHGDGRARLPRQVGARLSHGIAERVRMVRFAAATRNHADTRWSKFRHGVRTRIKASAFLIACMPFAGNVLRPRWLEIDPGGIAAPDAAWSDSA